MNDFENDKSEYTIFSDACWTDDVGGHHDCGVGWNPNGVWCGECSNETCRGCLFENNVE